MNFKRFPTVKGMLADLKAPSGMRYLFVSHDLNVVRLLCDRVIVMKARDIVEQGSSDDVLAKPKINYTCNLLANPTPTDVTARLMPAPDLDEFITASARVLALPVDPAWYPTVRSNLEVAFGLAALVAEFSLPDDAEPAPVFRA